MDLFSQVPRFLDLAVLDDLLDDVLHLGDVLGGGGVLPGRDLVDGRVGAEVQVEGLDPRPFPVAAGVGVDGDEKVRPLLVGDDGPVLEGNEDVRLPGQDDVEAVLFDEHLLQGQGDVQGDVLFPAPALSQTAGVRPAVAGVEDDRLDPQPQAAGSWCSPIQGVGRLGRGRPCGGGPASGRPALSWGRCR